MNFLTRHILAVLLVLMISVVVQIMAYGMFLSEFRAETLVMVSLCFLVLGLLSAFFIKSVSKVYFSRNNAVVPWLHTIVNRQAVQLGIDSPQINFSDATGINAFALGNLQGSGVLVLQQELLRQLTHDEIESVLAHENSHIALRHAMVLTIMQNTCLLPALPFVLLSSLVFSLIYDLSRFRSIFITMQGIFMLLLFPLTSFLIATVTRYWEYHADERAAELVGRDRYIAALRCLHGSFFQHPNLLNTTSMMRSHGNNEGWALSHPRLIQRINALRDDHFSDG